jgi:hypothetical protein
MANKFKPSDAIKLVDTNHAKYADLIYDHGGGNPGSQGQCFVESVSANGLKYHCISIDGKHSFDVKEDQAAVPVVPAKRKSQ